MLDFVENSFGVVLHLNIRCLQARLDFFPLCVDCTKKINVKSSDHEFTDKQMEDL